MRGRYDGSVMPKITINQEDVPLIEQSRESFAEFLQLAFPRCVPLFQIPRERRFIAMLPAAYMVRQRVDGVGWDDHLLQVSLWNLHDLGVREASFGVDAWENTAPELRPEGDPTEFVRFDRADATDMAKGTPSSINFSTVNSGRGFIAALNNVVHRVFDYNDEQLEVGMQPTDDMKKVITLIHQARQNQEGLLFATGRTLGSFVRQGLSLADTEVRCAIEILSSMGCVSVAVDPEAGKMAFRGFSVMAAMSSALLQGMDWDRIQEIRANVEKFQAQLATGESTPIKSAEMPMVGSRRRR